MYASPQRTVSSRLTVVTITCAVNQFVYGIAELEDENVAVVSLYPGIVTTEMMQDVMAKDDFEENVRCVRRYLFAAGLWSLQDFRCLRG